MTTTATSNQFSGIIGQYDPETLSTCFGLTEHCRERETADKMLEAFGEDILRAFVAECYLAGDEYCKRSRYGSDCIHATITE